MAEGVILLMMNLNSQKPFQELGSQLKAIRSGAKQSVAEVSGAVEIDRQQLMQFERGERRPTEDILLLLISHFNVETDEASRLWKLAGYSDKQGYDDSTATESSPAVQQVMISPQDLKIVMVNDYGVVINFMQGSGNMIQPLAVSRVGMSREHARSVIDVLQKTLLQSKASLPPKQLPAPQEPTDLDT